jgi:hypothetical protein
MHSLGLRPLFRMINQGSRLYITAREIVVYCILIFTSLDIMYTKAVTLE